MPRSRKMNRTGGRRRLRKRSRAARVRALKRTARAIILNHPDPARVLEFYYWSREDGLTDLIRALANLPATTRGALRIFLSRSADPRLISVAVQKPQRLVLASHAGKAKKAARR
jgi:hypothetical protein